MIRFSLEVKIKYTMKKMILACAMFLIGVQFVTAQTLVAGDLAVIGINEDSGPTLGQDHSFTFITLKDVPAGEVVYFTEQGWNDNNAGTPDGYWMGNTEGHISWTAPAGGAPCGTIVRIYETGSDVMNIEGIGAVSGLLSGGSWNLSGGDQVIAYYSAAGVRPAGIVPQFITAMHMDDSRSSSLGYNPSTTWTSSSYLSTGVAASHVPPGLTNGLNCIALHNPTNASYYEVDNVRYNGSLTGSAADLRTLIFKSIQGGGTWQQNNSTALNISPSSFSPNVNCAVVCSSPDEPTVSASLSSICPSGNSTLSWTGNLNDATAWHVYTGSCGGTQIGTTTSNSMVVSPSSNTIYYVRGEGGCVTPGSCGTTTITAVDNVDPVITTCASTPANISANGSCQGIALDLTGGVTATDNCTGTPVITQSPAAGTVLGLGTTTITLTATDASGNTATCTVGQTVVDNTDPVITVCAPTPANISANGSCQGIALDLTGGVTATDNCTGTPVITQSPAAGTVLGLGTTTITLTATDASGNTATCTVGQTVVDNTDPVISCPGNQIVDADASCQGSLMDYTALASASDNCSSTIVTQSPVAGTLINIGVTAVTLTVTDGAGNSEQCTFDVELIDNTIPTVVCQNVIAYLDGSGNATITAADIDGGSTDNCSGLTLTASQLTFTCADLGANDVTLTGTDSNNNSSDCIAVVTVMDTISPVVNCLSDQTELATIACQFTLPDYTTAATVFATDNCTSTPTITQAPVAGTLMSLGTSVVTLTAVDGNGNSSSCTFNVTVNTSASGVLDSTLCYGDSFVFNGTTYDGANTTGVETLIGAASNGCDSTVNVTVTMLPEIDVTVLNEAPELTANQVGATYQWIDCNADNVNIAGETNQTFNATINGDYAVIVSLSGCSDTSDCNLVANIGVEENSLFNEVYIYPNPNHGIVNVELGTLKDVTIQVFTVSGQLVYVKENINSTQHVLNLNEESGIYFVEVISNNEKQIYKLIVN